MRKILAILALASLLSSASAFAAKVGDPAPDFTGKGSDGKSYHLADLRGKFVVLEWHNQSCPFVKKHYGSGNMQQLQQEWTAKGVTWLTILSSAPGKQGSVSAEQENAYLKEKKAVPTAAILDPEGTIGNLYGAKSTPHMFVIDPKGTLIYNGAIDDKPTADPSDIPGAKNYVSAALTQAMAGKPVAEASTRPYGCSVKYK